MSDTIQLPFDNTIQCAVIGHMLTHNVFFLQAVNKMRPEWFISKMNSVLFDIIQKFYKENRRCPSAPEIKNTKIFLLEDQAVQVRLAAHLQACINATGEYKLDIIKKDLTAWLHAVTFKNGVEKGVNLFNNKKIDEAYLHINDVVKQLRDASFESEPRVSFKDFETILDRVETMFKGAYSTGLRLLDQAILSGTGTDGVRGSLVPKDQTVLLAPVNVGKTTVSLTMAVFNALAGNKILFLTHEGNPDTISKNIFACATGMNYSQLMQARKDPEGRKILAEIANRLDTNMSYVHYEKPGMTIQDVEPLIYREQERLLSSNSKLDMIFNDYPALLRMKGMNNDQERIIQAAVYRYFGQIVADVGAHGVSAVQANREGSRVVKAGERCLRIEDVAEAWGIPQIAATMISLNRQVEGPFKDIMTYFICKTRTNQVGGAVACKTDLSCARMHSNDLGAVSYNGNIFMPDRAKMYIENDSYRNKDLPFEALQVTGDHHE